MPDTLLVLGASHDQLFAIRTAQRMGLRVLAVDMNPASPGFAVADDHAVVSTRDVPALKRLLDDYRHAGRRVAGVTTMGSDIPQVVATLAAYLGTPGPSMQTALWATHKYEMKRRFRACNVPVPWFARVYSIDDLVRAVDERGFPLVIKPVDRSGARGVFRLTRRDQLADLFAQAKAMSFSGEVMVEEYLEGLQISTETLMYQGKGHTPGFADRNYELLEVYAPNIIENGGSMPTVVSQHDREAVERLVERAALALGVENGVAKGDVVLTAAGPVMIEMAARLSGGDFSESLIPLSIGVNIVEAAISVAIGRSPDLDALQPRWSKAVFNRYFFPRPGRVARIEGVEEVRRQPWIKKFELWYQVGDLTRPIASHADRFGVFIAVGDSLEEVRARAAWVYETVRISTEPVA